MAAQPRFPGCPRETEKYLKALARNNDREWFQAHREHYEDHYLAPAQAFVSAIAPELRKLSKGIAAALASIEDERLEGYRPWHSAWADLLERAGRRDEAARALRRALDLTRSEPERRHLSERLAELERDG